MLARDLHDTVAHHVSAIAIRAQAGLAVAESNPDAATDALRVIEAEASTTLAEMRSMVRRAAPGRGAGPGAGPRSRRYRATSQHGAGPRVHVRVER